MNETEIFESTRNCIFFFAVVKPFVTYTQGQWKIKEHSIEWSNEKENRRERERERARRNKERRKKATECFFSSYDNQNIYMSQEMINNSKVNNKTKWSMHRWMGFSSCWWRQRHRQSEKGEKSREHKSVESQRAINVEFKFITKEFKGLKVWHQIIGISLANFPLEFFRIFSLIFS